MKVLSTSAMRELERRAIEELGIPSILLMENAALGVVEAALAHYPDAARALIFCGPGNNGGDGLAIARQLAARGLKVTAVLANAGRDYAGDAGVQLEIVRRMAGRDLDLVTLDMESDLSQQIERLPASDLAVDALFGTGLSRALSGAFANLAREINGLSMPRVAVDLPSGLDGDSSEISGPHVEADVTVTFAAPKPAHVLPPAEAFVGSLVVSNLGIPGALVDEAPGTLFLQEGKDLAALLARRARAAHKGDFGHLLVVAGSRGKSGAAVLAAQAAVRSGVGLVTAAVPSSIFDSIETASIETMAVALPASPAGEMAAGASDILETAAIGKDAIALGPGLGGSEEARSVARSFCLSAEAPLVVDADGLNAFSGRLAELAGRAGATVLTPHPGELGRLLGQSTAEVAADRLGSARRAAREADAVVVLKGRRSLIAEPSGVIHINPTGNPGMATGGTGDVLTGILGALLAQGLEASPAAQLAAFVHGLSGDLGAQRVGERSLAARDLLEFLPRAFEHLAEADGPGPVTERQA